MKKFAIILIIILILIIAVSGFLFFYKDTYFQNKAVSNNDASSCAKIGSDYKKGQCYAQIAINSNSPQLCSGSPGIYISSCLRGFADAKQDITSCIGIQPEVDEYNCITAFAFVKKTASICEKLSDEKKNYCFKSIAISNNDPTFCNLIPASSGYKPNCESDVKSLQ